MGNIMQRMLRAKLKSGVRFSNYRSTLLWLCLCAAAPAAIAQQPAAVVKVGDALQRFNLLRPGVHRYLRYNVKGDQRSAIDIWSRTISFEEREGSKVMHISQHWDEVSNPVAMLDADAYFETGTFRPLTSIEKDVLRAGGTEIDGFRFLPDKIVGMKDLEGNASKDFSIASPEPAFNFIYDMELLQALPLDNNYAASIEFYDPDTGDKQPPARYVFKVAGSEAIVDATGRSIDCWKVTADYNTGVVRSTFWYDKTSQVLLREEAKRKDGSVLVKMLLNTEAADRAAL